MPAMTPDVAAAAAAVEHAHRDERHVLRDAVRRSADGAGDVRAVTVAVVRRIAVDEVGTPRVARPPNSLCVGRMPVSMMYAVTPVPSFGYV